MAGPLPAVTNLFSWTAPSAPKPQAELPPAQPDEDALSDALRYFPPGNFSRLSRPAASVLLTAQASELAPERKGRAVSAFTPQTEASSSAPQAQKASAGETQKTPATPVQKQPAPRAQAVAAYAPKFEALPKTGGRAQSSVSLDISV